MLRSGNGAVYTFSSKIEILQGYFQIRSILQKITSEQPAPRSLPLYGILKIFSSQIEQAQLTLDPPAGIIFLIEAVDERMMRATPQAKTPT